MKRYLFTIVSVAVIGLMMVSIAVAESTLERIEKRGEFLVGAREGSVPFGFYDKDGKWGGFSMDIFSSPGPGISPPKISEITVYFNYLV